MKSIKIAIAGVIIIFIAFLIFNKSEKINIDGYWTAKKIVLNGQLIFPSEIEKYLTVGSQVQINNWTDSILFIGAGNEIRIHFKTENSPDKNHYITLSSSEKSLNGKFTMKIDTLHIGPQAYQVNLKLEHNNTFLYFQKEVIVPPWKPEFPKKGKI